jgi:predicted DNA binding protein
MIKEKGYYERMRIKKKEAIAKSLGISEKQLKKLVKAHFID